MIPNKPPITPFKSSESDAGFLGDKIIHYKNLENICIYNSFFLLPNLSAFPQ